MSLHNIHFTPFHPPAYLANPHLQTIIPKFIRQTKPNYHRELRLDSTGTTNVAYDFVYANGSPNPDKPLAMMFHGLEGGSDSHYAIAFANYAKKHGWDSVIVHYRGCGGVANTAQPDYNAGDVTEAKYVLQQLSQQYSTIFATGVSLGGNLLAKYMGDMGETALCQGACVISAPVDLTTSAIAMHKFVAKRIYTPYLLKPLLKKAFAKVDDPELIQSLKKIKTIDRFDDLYTAPRHGYGTGADYYRKASALPLLKDIQKPTLIITAKDDPFLGILANSNDISANVRLLYSEHGGHVGFIRSNGRKLDIDWLPETTFKFFQSLI